MQGLLRVLEGTGKSVLNLASHLRAVAEEQGLKKLRKDSWATSTVTLHKKILLVHYGTSEHRA